MSGTNRYCVGNRKGLRRATLQGWCGRAPLEMSLELRSKGSGRADPLHFGS